VKPSEQVYWIKAAGAVLAGGICMYLRSIAGLQEGLTILVGIAIYIALSEVLAVLTEVDRNRTIRIGVGAYLFIWIFVWTILNTLYMLS
jgi:hypothetical protein